VQTVVVVYFLAPSFQLGNHFI